MKITDIRIALRHEEHLKAFVSITLDECLVIKGLKIIRGNMGFFVAMPSRRRSDGTHVDIAHPISRETRDWMESEILEQYRQVLADKGGDFQGESSGVPLSWIVPPPSLGFGKARERPA